MADKGDWSSLSKRDKTIAVEQRLRAGKRYADIAAEFGMTKGGVAGFVYRQGLTSISTQSRRALQPVGARNPLIRQIFQTAELKGISLNAIATRSGHDFNIIQNARRGEAIPHLHTIIDLAQVVGLKLTLTEDT